MKAYCHKYTRINKTLIRVNKLVNNWVKTRWKMFNTSIQVYLSKLQLDESACIEAVEEFLTYVFNSSESENDGNEDG